MKALIGVNKPEQLLHLLTMLDLSYIIQDMTNTERTIETTNPYSGQSEMLTPEEYKLYIMIKQAELDEDYKTMQKGLTKFSKMNAKAYMTLLD